MSHPQTFNEKVNWRIIKDRRPLLEGTCDKLEMKERALAATPRLVRVPRTFWVGTDVAELAHVDLPERWVLKPNHRTGLVYLGEGRPEIADLAARTAGWAEGQHWRATGEWAYRFARPCLLVEEFIGEPGKVPNDYKVLVFDGVPQLITVHTGRFADHRISPYLPDWTRFPFTPGDVPGAAFPRPERLEDMLKCAAVLAEGFDLLRVDFYEHDGELWFGELTPYPGSGMLPGDDGWNEAFGSWWTLPAVPGPLQRLRARLAELVPGQG